MSVWTCGYSDEISNARSYLENSGDLNCYSELTPEAFWIGVNCDPDMSIPAENN